MREVGIDLDGHRSKGLPDLPEVEFDVVVTMGCGDLRGRVRGRRHHDWGDVPAPKGMPPEQFRAVRDRIEARVQELLAGLGC
jgi:arsenate reductase